MRILSGVFEDERTGGQVTTGTPISLMIENVDQRSKRLFRDRHRLPARPRRLHLFRQVRRARLSRRRPAVGPRDRRPGGRRRRRPQGARRGVHDPRRRGADRPARRSTATAGTGPRPTNNPFWCPDPEIVPVWEEHLETIRKAGSSTGAIVEVEATGVPAGWGAPVYGKLDAELAGALMSINAAKGVEIGAGFAAAALTGEENADEMRMGNDGADVPVQPRRRHPGRHLHRPAGDRARGVQADLLDPHARAERSTRPARRSSCAPRAATTPAWASAPCRWSRPWSPASWPTPSCATAARPAAGPLLPAAANVADILPGQY